MMLLQHNGTPCVHFVITYTKYTRVITKCFCVLGYYFWEKSCWQIVLMLQAVIWTICEYILFG